MIARVDKVAYTAAGFGEALTHDLARGATGALPFFPARKWQDVARRIDGYIFPRAETAQILAAANADAPAAVLENIRSLEKKNTYVVATGQQAGFLGVPLYTLYKALTAIKLARRYEQDAGGAAHFVPLFWVAGDDHDLQEIDHAWFLRQNGVLARISAALAPGSAGSSACEVAIPAASLDKAGEELKSLLPECAAIVQWLELYKGRSMSGAFAALLRRWLGNFGLVVVESQALRPLSRELLRRELEDYSVTYNLIQEAGADLARAGYQAGFGSGLRAPHFFIELGDEKRRVRLEPATEGAETKFIARVPNSLSSNQTFSKAALLEMIQDQPERFSFSAALRPVLQQSVFPVVATVLGPGEINYWAQTTKVHERFEAIWPVVAPRASLTLLDARGLRAVRKIGLEPGGPELFDPFESLKEKMLSSSAFAAKLAQQQEAVLAGFQALEAEVRGSVGGLEPMLEKTRARITHELSRITEKATAVAEEQKEPGEARAQYLSSLVRPRNTPQERVLCCAQFMAEYPSLPEELLGVLDLAAPEHLVVSLG